MVVLVLCWFFLGFPAEFCKGRIPPNTLQISQKSAKISAKILPLQIFPNLTPVMLENGSLNTYYCRRQSRRQSRWRIQEKTKNLSAFLSFSYICLMVGAAQYRIAGRFRTPCSHMLICRFLSSVCADCVTFCCFFLSFFTVFNQQGRQKRHARQEQMCNQERGR